MEPGTLNRQHTVAGAPFSGWHAMRSYIPPTSINGDQMPMNHRLNVTWCCTISLVLFYFGFDRHGSEWFDVSSACWESVRLTFGSFCQFRKRSRNGLLRFVKPSASMASVGTQRRFLHVCLRAAMSISTRFSAKDVAKRWMASNRDLASVTGQMANGDLPEWEAMYSGHVNSPNIHPRKFA